MAKKRNLNFKDEGGFYTLKITKDGKPAENGKMYQFGELETMTFNKKLAKEFANGHGMIATFD